MLLLDKSEDCPLCGIEYDDDIVMHQKCKPYKCSNQCGFSACLVCLVRIINETIPDEDEDGIPIVKCPRCGENFNQLHIIKT